MAIDRDDIKAIMDEHDDDDILARAQWCVVEELASSDNPIHAYIVFGGFSLCYKHFHAVTNLIRAGMPMGEIVHTMMTDGLD